MSREEKKSPYLTVAEAATYLRLEERTLNNMRWRGEGPGYRKHGGKVVYHIAELDGWSRSRDCGYGGFAEAEERAKNARP